MMDFLDENVGFSLAATPPSSPYLGLGLKSLSSTPKRTLNAETGLSTPKRICRQQMADTRPPPNTPQKGVCNGLESLFEEKLGISQQMYFQPGTSYFTSETQAQDNFFKAPSKQQQWNNNEGKETFPKNSFSFPSLFDFKTEGTNKGQGQNYFNFMDGISSAAKPKKTLPEIPPCSMSPIRSGYNQDSLSPPARLKAYNPAQKKFEYECVFCKGNGESETAYKSHPIRVNDTVICPSLRGHVCAICGATGDNAHTVKYCPFNNRGFFAGHQATKQRIGALEPAATVNSTSSMADSEEYGIVKKEYGSAELLELCYSNLRHKKWPNEGEAKPFVRKLEFENKHMAKSTALFFKNLDQFESIRKKERQQYQPEEKTTPYY